MSEIYGAEVDLLAKVGCDCGGGLVGMSTLTTYNDPFPQCVYVLSFVLTDIYFCKGSCFPTAKFTVCLLYTSDAADD